MERARPSPTVMSPAHVYQVLSLSLCRTPATLARQRRHEHRVEQWERFPHLELAARKVIGAI